MAQPPFEPQLSEEWRYQGWRYPRPMDSGMFEDIALSVLGPFWDDTMAELTGFPLHSIRRMANGKKRIPDDLACALGRANQTLLLLAQIVAKHGKPDEVDVTLSHNDQVNRWVVAMVRDNIERLQITVSLGH